MRPLFFVASSMSAVSAAASMGETLRVALTERAASVRPDVFDVPAPADLMTIVVAIVAVSTSGPLMAATAAPALAIAFWRNAMAAGVLVPWALVTRRTELRTLRGHTGALAVG